MPTRRILLAAAVLLAGLGSVSATRQAKPIQIVIEKAAYMPDKLSVPVGSVVEWINKDVVAHTATARSKDWQVVVQANKAGRAVMKKDGTFDYYCEYHPNMTARLVVTRPR